MSYEQHPHVEGQSSIRMRNLERKPSTTSSFSILLPPPVTPAQRSGASRGSPYPPESPRRNVYVAARVLSSVLAAALIIVTGLCWLDSVQRPKWSAPVLSPAITALFHSSWEVWAILRMDIRSAYIRRTLFDGAMTIGYAIAFGFLASFIAPDVRGSREDASVSAAAVGLALEIMMFIQMLLHAAYSFSGAREWRRSKKGYL